MRIFLLCCGPSVKYQNLQCLSGETCVSVSNFFVHSQINEIEPKYHLFAPIHPPITNEMATLWFKEANDVLPNETTIVMNHKDINLWNNFEHQRNIITYNPRQIMYQSVSQIALNFILSMKPNEIYLIGCDHNWVRHVGTTKHFYDHSESIIERMGYDEWFGQSKEEAQKRELQCNMKLFKIYDNYKNIAEQNSIQIYNVTPGSRLKTFDFTTLFNIFEEPTMDKI